MSFPEIIDPSSPLDNAVAATMPAQLRALKQFLVDVFGLPVSPTDITAPAMSITAAGVCTVNAPIPPLPMPGAINLVGSSVALNTTMVVSADFVYLGQGPSGPWAYQSAFTASCLVVGTQTGPTLNARDQTGPFGANAFYHLYAISGNNEPAGLIASLQLPANGGPALPTGYTNWCYLGTFLTNVNGNLDPQYLAGDTVYYQAIKNVLGTGAPAPPVGTPTVIPNGSYIPPIASRGLYTTTAYIFGTTGESGGATLVFGLGGSASTFWGLFFAGTMNSAVGVAQNGQFEAPNVGLYYSWQNISDVTEVAVAVNVFGYKVPNQST